MNKFLFSCWALFLCVFASWQTAHAAAWTLPNGQIKSFQSVYSYTADNFFDSNGNKKKQSSYSKLESDNLLEYGIWDDLTFGLKFGYVAQQQNQNFGSYHSSGISDPEISLRYNIWTDESHVVSLQPMVKFFVADESALIPLGTGSADIELRVLYGRSYEWQNRNHYMGAEAAYKRRGGNFVDEVRFDTTFGFNIFDGWDVVLQSFSIISHGGDTGVFSNTVPNDYQAHKAQLSFAAKFSEKYTVQLGGYKDVYGENSGAGIGYFLSLWTTF